jgi:hypothetical protein
VHLVAVVALAATALFRLHDPRIDEASGIARGITSPGVFYVQNDSGDSARFFAIDAKSGRTRAEYTVPDATNVDWEDLAVAPDAAGTPSVWLADIGDNDAVRDEVQLYRVDEPRVDMTRTDVVAHTRSPDVWRLRYPSGPVNAESLAVAPNGRAYIVTKASDGHSVVYAVPHRPDAQRIQQLRRIGSITFHSHGGLIPARLQMLATGATLSPNGRLLVIRTYTDAYVWHVRRGDVAAAIKPRPERVAIPLQLQGEGVCFDGRSLVLDSEGKVTPVYQVPLPGASIPLPRESQSVPTASTRPSAPSPSRPTPAAQHRSSAPKATPYVLAAAGFVLLLIGAVALSRRNRRE